jgi:hypothetical protein
MYFCPSFMIYSPKPLERARSSSKNLGASLQEKMMPKKETTNSQKPTTASLKPSLAWTLADYKAHNEEPPQCVIEGRTEGEIMDREEAIDWIVETIRFLRVLLEDYPGAADIQKQVFELDLDYLVSLGRITMEEKEDLTKEENYSFYDSKAA